MSHTNTPAVLLVVLILLAFGCGGKPAARTSASFVRAQPIKDPPPKAPVVVQVPQPMPLPGQLKPTPATVATSRKSMGQNLQQVIAEANQKAAQVPEEAGYFNSIMQYSFAPGSLYQVYTAPMRITDIVMQPGEKILGQPASGDVVRWILALGKSIDNGVDQWHVYIKPTRPDLDTNLAINTDRRTYLLELHSFKDTYMASVKWQYPQDEVARLAAQASELVESERSSIPVVNLDSLNFNYAVQIVKGRPTWTPVQIFDDGRKTFLRFPPAMLVREAPALFVLRDKETQLVNYRVKNEFYVVDRLIDSAELRVGQQDQEIVRIVRTSRP